MEETIFVIFLAMSVALILFGFIRRQYLMILVGGAVMDILGAMFIAGIYYQTGTLVNMVNSTFYNITNVYSVYSRGFSGFGGLTFNFSEIWGLILIVIGTGMVLISVMQASSDKRRISVGDDEE